MAVRVARGVALLAVLACIVGAGMSPPPLAAATTATQAEVVSDAPDFRLSGRQAERIARADDRIEAWGRSHPLERFEYRRDRDALTWTVDYMNEDRSVHAQVIVDDTSGTVREVRTGHQVAWQMARGYRGAFGRSLTEPQIWIPLFLLFLVPLIRWRHILSWHTLDLLMLCGFGISLIWFNRGEIGTSVPLVYPPLGYLFVRLCAIGLARSRSPQEAMRAQQPRLGGVFPTWLIVTIALFAVGLRLGLNVFDSNVIDVGYAGVIGADRIASGQTPYGTFPADCSTCDTYGPAIYQAYVPFEAVAGWTGTWDDLPAAHGAAVFFDLAALAGLVLLGWRIGGWRVGAGLGLAWAAFPFTAYALESNSNDSLIAALLVWGLVVAHHPVRRGIALALAVWAKFIPAILLLLWARHPFPRAPRSPRYLRYVGGLAIGTALAVWPVALDGTDGIRAFWSRTVAMQIDRESPFSLWGMHPDLRWLQILLQAVVVVLAIAVIRVPRSLDLRRFAALSGALIIGVQITMPHWFYLYIPWFLPFAFVALVPTWVSRSSARVRHDLPYPGPPAAMRA